MEPAMTLAPSDVVLFGAVFAAGMVGIYIERFRAQRSRRNWRRRNPNGTAGRIVPFGARPAPRPTDAAEQLRLVMAADFRKRHLLSKSETRVFEAAEAAIRAQRLTWRVMAQVSLGEILASPDARAYGAINSKRVDVLLVAHDGQPVAAVEYQGGGHYQGSAPARDAVKKEALRKAGVGYIELTEAHNAKDLAREIARLAAARP